MALFIERVMLRFVRNIRQLDWKPDPGVNLIWGDNGHGKTNLLEGMHYALTGRSFRTHRDEESLSWALLSNHLLSMPRPESIESTLAQVELIDSRQDTRRLRLLMGKGWKRVFVNETLLERLADLWREANVVTFTPEDAGLLKGPPSGRRRFLDIILAQSDPYYLRQLQEYGQAYKQVNAIYRMQPSGRDARELIEPWLPGLAQAGVGLMKARSLRLQDALVRVAQQFEVLGGIGDFSLKYEPGIRSDAEEMTHDAYIDRVQACYEESRRQGSCVVGVHRDDFEVRIDGIDIRRFGSQGQQRLAALALKLESAYWLETVLNERPILMLDDFGSELDPERRRCVLQCLAKNGSQVFITAVDPHDFGLNPPFSRTWHVRQGLLAD